MPTIENITENNRLIAEFMGLPIFAEYRNSGMKDINGKPILEGSIINANGYDSDISNPDDIYVHAVEFYKGQFGSDVYSDFEPLSRYHSIEVVGHVKDYAHRLDNFNEGIDGFEWSGNLGAALKKNPVYNFDKDWNAIMPVLEKIESKGAIIDIWMSLGTGCRIIFKASDPTPNHTVNEDNQPINAIYRSVVDYVKWYNQNKQP